MYSTLVPEWSSGKTLKEFLSTIAETDDFVQVHGSGYSESSCIVVLEDRVIASTAQSNTIVNTGQSVKIFPMVHGG